MTWRKIKFPFFKKENSMENTDGIGLVIFYVTEDAIKAEKVIKNSGCFCKLVAPPPELRKGCDLALEVELVEQPIIERLLASQVPIQGIFPLTGTAEILPIVKVAFYDGYSMVKAGNMKITFDNITGVIVNISGGGCPDIPYLSIQMIGKHLSTAPSPSDIGYTLCALMLDRAHQECLYLWDRREKVCY